MLILNKTKFIFKAIKRVRFNIVFIRNIFFVFKNEGFEGIWGKIHSISSRPNDSVRQNIEHVENFDYSTLDELLESNKRKILIIVHELSLTGAPIAAFFAAKALKKNGDCPVVACEINGPLKNEFEKNRIPVLVDSGLNQEDKFRKLIYKFNLLIINTIVPAMYIEYLQKEKIPVIWWIHESNLSYSACPRPLPKELPKNIKIYCVGEYARAALLSFRKKYTAKILLYGIEDIAQENNIVYEDNKTVFSMVGTLEYRKGHKVFIKAVQMMPEHLREKCRFIIVGREMEKFYLDRILRFKEQYPEQVEFLSELPRDEVINIYNKSTAIVSSSFDDPMPIVLTEGMALSKVCICSTGTGTAPLIQDKYSGFVFKNGDARELLSKMIYVIENREKLDNIKKAGREIFEKYFHMQVFQRNLQMIIDVALSS